MESKIKEVNIINFLFYFKCQERASIQKNFFIEELVHFIHMTGLRVKESAERRSQEMIARGFFCIVQGIIIQLHDSLRLFIWNYRLENAMIIIIMTACAMTWMHERQRRNMSFCRDSNDVRWSARKNSARDSIEYKWT